jgi:1-acyl-sn-glycerol-3-phosphate acyltransferase
MTLDQCQRGLGTALSFAIFGIGGLLIGLLIAPVLKLTIRDAARRRYRARVLIQYAFRAFIGLMRALGVLDYRFEELSRLQRPGLLILANHPSLIDVVFLLGHVPQADCIIKGKLADNPFTRGPIRAAGYITNREPDAVLDAARHSLAEGNSLILFPEGTRTRPDRPVKFRRGGANIALRASADITPVLIRCRPTTLTKGTPWYRIPPCKVQFDLRVLEDLPVPGETGQPTSVRARHFTRQLSEYFNHELERFQHA